MANVDDFHRDMAALKQQLRAAMPDIIQTVVISAKAIAERKIRDEGFGAKYSDNHIPTFFLKGKAKSGAGRAYIQKLEDEDEEGNWQGLRAAEGLQTAHVDLGFENKMWAAMVPGDVKEEDDRVTCNLAANNVEAQNKMNWSRDRYGDFISKVLLDPEREIFRQIAFDGLKAVLDAANAGA